ncbi:MAG: DUF1385 domain-containing protein [Candidatus Marinimicrobia bacterium]|nr:DUF1385 domain-containing protein [Candidatus Neomarinimicrobiota bacterium]|tara:strand:+ start:6530 stop:7504 length:975 start_codon:yes stop_codon:yes gene_type:complete
MKTKFLKQLILFVSKSSILVGGQAVIEGVMMRVPGAYSTAVRDPDGKIHTNRHDFESITDRKPHLKKPIIRGAVSLFEAMKMGFQTLQWSADIAMPEESENVNPIVDALMTLVSIALAICLFFAAPIALTTWLFDKDQDPFVFNIISGALRIFFFLVYLILISLLSDVKRLFQYHGAEHKTVYNFESGKSLNIKTAQEFPTQHPRCGTSFMFIIMIVAILSFAVLDSILMLFVGEIQVWMRLIMHIPFMPLVAGIGYEVLKLTAKHRENILFRMLAQPGLWLQNITTKQPDDTQVEVAIAALESAFGENLDQYSGKIFVAEAIG